MAPHDVPPAPLPNGGSNGFFAGNSKTGCWPFQPYDNSISKNLLEAYISAF